MKKLPFLGSDPRQVQRNMELLIGILCRASRPGVWAKLELYVDDGVMREQFKIESSVKTKSMDPGELREILDGLLGGTNLDSSET